MNTVIYLIDFSLRYYLPELNADIDENYGLGFTRTGGIYCALRVTAAALLPGNEGLVPSMFLSTHDHRWGLIYM